MTLCGCSVNIASDIDDTAPAPFENPALLTDEAPAAPRPSLGTAHLARDVVMGEEPTRPQTLADVLDGEQWRFVSESDEKDEALVDFVRDEEDGGIATFNPIGGASFPCAGEGRWAVNEQQDLTFTFPPGCGSEWLDVVWFDASSVNGWLGQVTPMHAFKNP